jgi:hypothetical protein
MGIRDMAWLEQLAADVGMARDRLYAMPANNYVVVWRKVGQMEAKPPERAAGQ